MSMVEDGRRLAGYTLDDVLANNRLGPPAATARSAEIRGRTLLDVIKDDEPSIGKGLFGKDKRTWKSFRDKLRLKRAGSAWVSTVPIPTSDMPFHTKRNLIGKRNPVRFNTRNPSDETAKSNRRQMSRQTSTMNSSSDTSGFHYDESSDHSSSPDSAPNRIAKPQMSRHNSVRITNPSESFTDPTEPDRDNRVRHVNFSLSEQRMMSAREAVAAQEAADAASASAAAEAAEEEKEQSDNDNDNENENEESTAESGEEKEKEKEKEKELPASEPVRMSLMDLLGESSYGMGSDEDYNDEDEADECEEDEDDGGAGGEFTCNVCSVKHKNAAMGPCGHTFCKLCSKELSVSRGHCPTCNDFILEVLDDFSL